MTISTSRKTNMRDSLEQFNEQELKTIDRVFAEFAESEKTTDYELFMDYVETRAVTQSEGENAIAELMLMGEKTKAEMETEVDAALGYLHDMHELAMRRYEEMVQGI